jgi:hypothetical protein
MCSPVTEDTFGSQMGILGFTIGGIYHGTVTQTETLSRIFTRHTSCMSTIQICFSHYQNVRVLWFIHTVSKLSVTATYIRMNAYIKYHDLHTCTRVSVSDTDHIWKQNSHPNLQPQV